MGKTLYYKDFYSACYSNIAATFVECKSNFELKFNVRIFTHDFLETRAPLYRTLYKCDKTDDMKSTL